jgi:hypothetical protein
LCLDLDLLKSLASLDLSGNCTIPAILLPLAFCLLFLPTASYIAFGFVEHHFGNPLKFGTDREHATDLTVRLLHVTLKHSQKADD